MGNKVLGVAPHLHSSGFAFLEAEVRDLLPVLRVKKTLQCFDCSCFALGARNGDGRPCKVGPKAGTPGRVQGRLISARSEFARGFREFGGC